MKPARHLVIISVECLRADFRKILPKLALPPHLDRAFVFETCVTPAVTTTAAQAALLTGELPLRNGVRRHFPDSLLPGSSTLFEALAEHDFHIAATCDFRNDFFNAGLLKTANASTRRLTEALRATAAARHRGRRTFLFVQHGSLHKGVHGRRDRAAYQRAVRNYFSRRLQQLWRKMERVGVLSDAAIMLVGVHGEGGNAESMGHGERVTDDCVRVPWIVWADGIKAGRTSNPVSLVDVFPTALEVLGMKAFHSGKDGSSRVKTLGGVERPFRGSACYSESWRYLQPYGKALALGLLQTKGAPSKWLGDWRRLRRFTVLHEQTVRAGSMKLVMRRRDQKWISGLYDLGSDPGETRDLLLVEFSKPAFRKIARSLRRRLARLKKTAAPSRSLGRRPVLRPCRLPAHFQLEIRR